jgi:endonuclease-8
MPEGDTIHKIAAFMAPRLTGRTVDNIRLGADGTAAFAGATIRAVEARGKHLWLELDNDASIRSHLGMYGSWHVYAGDETWQKPARQASLVLETGDERYVCFNARDVEIVDRQGVRERTLGARLGPDLVATATDPALLLARAREFDDGDTLLIDTLLDQRVAAGIGNVYKSEVMFLHRLPPGMALSATPDDTIAACFATAADLLCRNLGGGKRRTRFEGDAAGRLWVYGRAGQPCHECRTPIRQQRMGRHHRGTWWCPRCQA